jgi:alkaline phosphatase D
VLAQQVILAPVDFASNPLAGDGPTYSMDKWGGYEAARTRLIRFLSERQIPNPVVLTGDVHCNWVNDLKLDFQREGSLSVGTEFVGTSVTSTGDGSEKRENTDKVLSRNPFVKFFNSERGYVRCEVTPATWRSDYRTVPYVSRPGAACNTRASYLIENGRPDAVRVS